MDQHTAEPWQLRPGEGVDIISGPIGALAYVSTAGARGRTLAEAKANAKRIVECINACEGVSDGNLEPGLVRELVLDLDHERTRTTVLLAALKAAWQYATGEECAIGDESAYAEGEEFARVNRLVHDVIADVEGPS